MGRKRDKQLLLRYTSEEKKLIEDVLKDTGLNNNDGILKILKDYKEKQRKEGLEGISSPFMIVIVERILIIYCPIGQPICYNSNQKGSEFNMYDNSRRTRNVQLALWFTKEEKQQIYDLAKKLNLKLTELIIMLVKERSEKDE